MGGDGKRWPVLVLALKALCPGKPLSAGQTYTAGYPSRRIRPKNGQLGSFYPEHMEVRRARAEAQNCFRRWSESRNK